MKIQLHHLDNPLVLSTLFYPREADPGSSTVSGARDGAITVADGVALGYRLFPHEADAPLVVYWHGNGENVTDYDFFARDFHAAGASLLVLDYRGYGWSTGKPTVTALLGDTEPVLAALPGVVGDAGLRPKAWFMMGRSLGSAPAIHSLTLHPDRFAGLIIESGFAQAVTLLARLGLDPRWFAQIEDPVGNHRKIAEIETPLLVIHGALDNLIPATHGHTLHDKSPAALKRLLIVPAAGHNDLLFVARGVYFDAIAAFITAAMSA